MKLPVPFSELDMKIDEAEQLYYIYTDLKKTYQVDFEKDFVLPLDNFQVFGMNELNDKGTAFKIQNRNNNFFIWFPEIRYWHDNSKYSTRWNIEFQSWGYFKLKKDYGRILIRTETIADKIQELFNPIEVDFDDDKAFSKRFYVLTNDKFKTRLLLDKALRQIISDLLVDDFLIEINGNHLIIGNKKVIQHDFVSTITKFLLKLSDDF